jgi:multidrug efflux pump
MRLSEISIERPVLATVMSLVLLLAGAVSYFNLTVREYPQIDEPVISVTTQYPGANAGLIETEVTQILEGSLAGIEGIDTIESNSRSESSRITVRFRPSADLDAAASDVRDRVSRVRQRLPDDIAEPVIAKVEADAQPIMYLVFRSTTLSALELTGYINNIAVDRFKVLPGVADLTVFGERLYAMRVWLDQERLAGYGLTVADVENAIRAQNAELPAGRIESSDREFPLLSRSKLATPEQFAAIVLNNDKDIRLGDVARIELGAAEARRESRYNGEVAVSAGIVRNSLANPLDVSKEVRAELPALKETLPPGVSVELGYDSAVFIARSIEGVTMTIFEAVMLVVLIVLFFLHSFRAALIPIVTIPVSLIATFVLMAALGLTVNTLTLLAMVLAIGLVVDDAIVVLENVHRHVEEGMKPMQAAFKGMGEIGFAIIAMTLTLAAVYAPVAFTPGTTGRLFAEFAIVLAGSVLISGFVALTLSPMMAARLPERAKSNFITRAIEGLLRWLETAYRRVVAGAVRFAVLPVILALGAAAIGVFAFTQLKSELTPVEDRGTIIIRGSAPEGATFAFTSRYAREIEKAMAETQGVASTLVNAGSPEASQLFAIARLRDWSERDVKQQQIAAQLQRKFAQVPGIQANASNPQAFGRRGGGRGVEIVIRSAATYEELGQLANRVVERLRDDPRFVEPESDLKLNTPQIEIAIDRGRAADLGIDIAGVGRTIETLFGGRDVTRFELDGEQYDVIVQMAASGRASPESLSRLFVPVKSGDLTELSNIASIKETTAPKDLRRFNQLRAVTVAANLAPGFTLGEAISVAETAARDVLQGEAEIDWSGQAREYREASGSLFFIFGLAIVFIYLVLAAQFESFRDPLLILLTVPLALSGALLVLWLAGGTLNVYSQIGLVTLVGLIAKHGILIVDVANNLQREGKPRRDAAIEAAALRLRPILMTTFAMALGALPLAYASGAGAESRQQIGWVISGGLAIGTLFTLFVIPAVYGFAGRRLAAPVALPKPHLVPAPGKAPLARAAE